MTIGSRRGGARRAWAAAAALACGVTLARDARAQEATALAARRELIEQAQQARAAGDHARALDLAERAGRIASNASVRLFVAQEHNALGHLADAYGEASRCAAEAAGDASLPNRATVLAVCRALANQLRNRVARVTVRMPAVVPPGATVAVANRALAEPLWGVAYPVTPGAVVVEASAPGHQPFRRELTLAAGASEEVAVALAPDPRASVGEVSPQETSVGASGTSATTTPPDTREPVPVTGSGTAGVTPDATPRDATGRGGDGAVPSAPAPRRDPGPRRVGAYVALGVGGAVLLATVPLVIVREVVRADCPGDLCPDPRTLARVRDTVYGASAAAVGTLVLGLAGVTTGIVLLATAPREARDGAGATRHAPRRAARAVVTGAVLPEGGGLLGVAGRF